MTTATIGPVLGLIVGAASDHRRPCREGHDGRFYRGRS
jgi:hypothetical protein